MNWMLYHTNIKNSNCKLYQRGKMFQVNLTIKQAHKNHTSKYLKRCSHTNKDWEQT